jgi:malate dehydrogenase
MYCMYETRNNSLISQDTSRKEELLQITSKFQEYGRAINEFAARDVKVVILGNPESTNTLITIANSPTIPRQNFR